MSDIVKIDGGNIASFLHHHGKGDLPRPFGQEIYLIDAHIAGTTHVEGIDALEPLLVPGMRLHFLREADNAYDPLAIMVKDANGNKLGYVPRAKNEILSRLMDAGKLIFGTLVHKERVGSWLKIEMQIFLDD
ncbi:MAG: HIRAN domain-containing protein [Synergistaceae bacterium]|nr:HIRAN domain-containing protein [Synergistaceae bacterium]